MLKIKPAPGASCTYCQSDKQVINAFFDDQSFSGTICFKDLWKMIQARVKDSNKSEQQSGKTKQSPTPEAGRKES